ncbi:GM24637 [Drosophila sechellia]|uniref:GM24637 n=1 Tax=Drosophila sechellia TaxID=7238 RepID=B4HG42_DROSE|nr:GM24637 [Drosophila sechellia]
MPEINEGVAADAYRFPHQTRPTFSDPSKIDVDMGCMELMQMEMESGNMLAKASENYRGQSAKRADCFNFLTVCNL